MKLGPRRSSTPVRQFIALALTSVCICAAPLRAEAQVLSRGAAIERALAQNPLVASARALELVASAHRGQARAARSPSISLTTAVGPSLRADLVPGSGAASTENIYGDVGLDDLSVVIGGELRITQPIYTFGKIDERIQAAAHELRARRAESEMARADLALTVAELYETLLMARDAERFFDETEHWAARTLEATTQELEAQTSDATEADVSRLKAALAATRIGLHQARAGRRQAEAGLAAYLMLPGGAGLTLREDSLEPIAIEAPSRETAVQLALTGRPELRALSEGSLAYAALARAEAASSLPDIFALGDISAAYTPGRDLADSRYVRDPLHGFYPALLLGIRWQLTFGMAEERAGEQRAQGTRLSELRRFASSGIPAEVVRALEDIERATEDIKQAELGVQSTKAWLVRASADYSIGLGDSRELTDAARAYVELRMSRLDAVRRHNVALAALTRATGTLEADATFYPTKSR